MIFFLFGNGPVEAFIAIFSQIKTLCFYTLFGQSILEIQFFWYFLYAHNILLKNKKKIWNFFLFLKITMYSLLFLDNFQKTKNKLLSCLAWRGFCYCSTVLLQSKIAFSVYYCLVRGYSQIPLSWAFGQPYWWRLQDLKNTNLPQKLPNLWKSPCAHDKLLLKIRKRLKIAIRS